MDIVCRARRVVARVLNAPEEEIGAGTALVADLGADSLAMMELLMAVEDEFCIQVADEEMMEVQTFGDLVGLLRRVTEGPADTV